jgi:hypothetical protein
MKHTDRIRKRDHVIAFLAGSTVCLLMTLPVVWFGIKHGGPEL